MSRSTSASPTTATDSSRIFARAWEFLGQGAVTIRSVDPDGHVVAYVGAYRVRRIAGEAGTWSCQCTAATFGNACSHVEACKLVT